MKTAIHSVHTLRRGIRVGFVPLTDCAPLVMAQELGLYQKYGLQVELSRELGWATIRDKMVHRELDAAHALAAMPIAATILLSSAISRVAAVRMSSPGARPPPGNSQ